MVHDGLELDRLGGTRAGSVALAGAVHALVVLVAAGSSYFVLAPIKEPARELVFVLPAPIPLDAASPLAAPASGAGRAPARLGAPAPPPERPRVEAPAPMPLTQPLASAPGESPAPSGAGAAVGVEGGFGDGEGLGGYGSAGEGSGGSGYGAGPGGPDPVPVGAGIAAPRLLLKIAPVYPEVARKARLEGRVVLRAIVGPEGDVESVEVVSATHEIFRQPSVEAVRRWRYTPTRVAGSAVRVVFNVEIAFVLR